MPLPEPDDLPDAPAPEAPPEDRSDVTSIAPALGRLRLRRLLEALEEAERLLVAGQPETRAERQERAAALLAEARRELDSLRSVDSE